MKKLLRAALAALILLWPALPALAQGTVPGQFVVPLGFCQQTLSGSVSTLATCTRGAFTGTGTGTSLVATSVTGVIKAGDAVAGTGVPAGTTIVGQVAGVGTPGGAGTYVTSAATTSSSASLTSGGIPAGARMAYITAVTANAVFRDDGGAPTTTIGVIIASGGSLFYTGALGSLQFIAASGSPVLNVAFYR